MLVVSYASNGEMFEEVRPCNRRDQKVADQLGYMPDTRIDQKVRGRGWCSTWYKDDQKVAEYWESRDILKLL